MGALDNLYCAARAYLASRPDCAAYMPTVTGASVPQPGAAFDPKHGRMGFYFLCDEVEYAPHAHAPREIYAILSGTVRYWNEVSGWSAYGAGDVIYTLEHRWHAMTTCNEPVLILWAWIGEDLNLVPILREEDQGSIPDGA